MKTAIKTLVLALVGFVLNLTNPSQNDFIDFASEEVKKKYPELDFKSEQSANGIEKLVAGFGNMMITNFLTEATTRKDYWLFSVYELNLKAARDFGVPVKNMKILGIAGQFIPLSKD